MNSKDQGSDGYVRSTNMIKYIFIVSTLAVALCFGQDHLRQGFQCLQQSQFEQALGHFEQVRTLEPDHLEAGLGTAQALMGLVRLDQAEKVLQELLQKHPGHPRVQLGLGQVYLALEDFASAVNYLEDARRQMPPNATLDASLALACYNQGVLTYQQGQKQQAVSLMRKSLALDSTNVKAYQNLAICHLELNDSKDAYQVLSLGLKRDPENRELLLLKAQSLIKEKKFAELVPIFTVLHRKYPDDVAIGIRLAYFLRFQNRSQEAVAVYHELAERFPKNKEVVSEWANHLMSGKDFAGARQLYTDFLSRTHDQPAVMSEIARTWVREKNYPGARESFRQIFFYKPCDVDIWKEIALTFEEQDSLPQAVQQYRQALTCVKTAADSAKLYTEIGRLTEDMNTVEAAEAYRALLRLSPQWDYPWVRLGLIYDQTGTDTTSLGFFRQAILLNSKDPSPYYFLSLHYWEKADSGRSRELALAAVHRGLDQREETRSQILGKVQDADGRLSAEEFETIGTLGRDAESMLPLVRMAIEHLIKVTPAWQRRQLLDGLWQKYINDTVLPEYLGQVLEQERMNQDAEFVYQRIIKANVRSRAAHAGLARIYELDERLPEAILENKRLIDIDSQDSTAYRALVRLHQQSGQVPKLRQEWRIKASVAKQDSVLLYFLNALPQD